MVKRIVTKNDLNDDFHEKRSYVSHQKSKKLSEYMSLRRESSNCMLEQMIGDVKDNIAEERKELKNKDNNNSYAQ